MGHARAKLGKCETCLVQVAVVAVQDGRDVHVDNVAVLELTQVGDPVADHLIYRGTERLWEVVIVERRRIRPRLDGDVVHESVDFISGHPGPDDPVRRVETLTP